MIAVPLIEADSSNPYVAYSYSYPHKSAYGPYDPAIPLEPIWNAEPRDSLFLYVHIPFCEMRCGFCNLFTQANAEQPLVTTYLKSLARQMEQMQKVLGSCTFSRLAIGGGTPTILCESELDSLFDGIAKHFAIDPKLVPTSVETSPKTATPERLRVLRDRGVERISIGVQSFLDDEVHRIGRPQNLRDVHTALERLREFPILNIDLIYGQPRQDLVSWEHSLRQALEYEPEELFLYPLYVRPGTGVGRNGQVKRSQDELTLAMYRFAHDLLLASGYEQISMRCFRLASVKDDLTPSYCCQRDGMVGLGCGARSYSKHLHYSTPFAVEAAPVQKIIRDWIASSDSDFRMAHWGIRLSEDERKRRFVIQSLLQRSGISEADYESEFGLPINDDFPILKIWHKQGWVEHSSGSWHLSTIGFERSDQIGPAPYAPDRLRELEEFSRC